MPFQRKRAVPVFRCSFCGKRKDEVEHLVAGPRGVYICNECVECARATMQAK